MRGQANVLRRWKVKRAGEIKNIYLKVTVPVEKVRLFHLGTIGKERRNYICPKSETSDKVVWGGMSSE